MYRPERSSSLHAIGAPCLNIFKRVNPLNATWSAPPHLPAEPVQGQSRSAYPIRISVPLFLWLDGPTRHLSDLSRSRLAECEIEPLDEHRSVYEKLINDAGNGAKC